jgi:hypothetical protein
MDTGTPTPSTIPSGRITGRVVLDGSPASEGVFLVLEDQSYAVIAETTVAADGVYAFDNLPASAGGYNVLFAQESNTDYYGTDQVISWGWIGPVVMGSAEVVELPDFEISLLGFGPASPEPDDPFSAAELGSDNPIIFEWTAYPHAETYWVDLVKGVEEELVWQSGFIEDTSVLFDGTLDDGTSVQAEEYWWGAGARRELGAFTLTLYGYLSQLTVEP